MAGITSSRVRCLSTWDQVHPRDYFGLAFCFPFDHNSKSDALSHLVASLDRIKRDRPEFAGRVEIGPAKQSNTLFLHESESDEIPLEVVHCEDDFGWTYNQLKEEGFPPAAFCHPRYAYDGAVREGESVSVVRVFVFFIDGGMILSINLHHSLFDGECSRLFIEYFAAITRGEEGPDMPSNLSAEPLEPRPESVQHETPAKNVIDINPGQPLEEISLTPMKDIENTGKIFVFRNEKLGELQDILSQRLEKRPSSFCTLMALSWAYVSKARSAESYVSGSATNKQAELKFYVNWGTRAFQGQEWLENYFGNTATAQIVKIDRERVSSPGNDLEEMADIIREIDIAIKAVDDSYVSRCNALFASAEDFTSVQVPGEPFETRKPYNLFVNTWRFAGADKSWSIPGILSGKPDAVRRTLGQWKLGRALLLPGRVDSGIQELFVMIPVSSMSKLCTDEGWLRWVDKIVG